MENCDVMSRSQDGAREQHAMLTAVEIEHAESTPRRQFRPPDPAGQPARVCGQQECLLVGEKPPASSRISAAERRC